MHWRHYSNSTPHISIGSGFPGFTVQLGDTAAVLSRAGALLSRSTGASRPRGARADPAHQDSRVETWRAAPCGHQAQVGISRGSARYGVKCSADAFRRLLYTIGVALFSQTASDWPGPLAEELPNLNRVLRHNSSYTSAMRLLFSSTFGFMFSLTEEPRKIYVLPLYKENMHLSI